MPRTTRVIALGLLWLALASSVLQAAPSMPNPRAMPAAESGHLAAAVWKWIVSIVVPRPESMGHDENAAPVKNTVPVEQGSQLDPDGNH
jgi:hypothetical protein